jgi:tRNA(Ile)-lysidine synthase
MDREGVNGNNGTAGTASGSGGSGSSPHPEGAILPPRDSLTPPLASALRWSRDHQRLHRHLRRHPALLPAGAPLLLAVSGGQDSMALTGLLGDLRRLHGWTLRLWHGDHRWRAEGATQAGELALWAERQGLPLRWERADPAPAGEEAARRWRYAALAREARRLGIHHIVTGHTATDRAETVLLNLARGSHRRGIGSLRSIRPLREGSDPDRPVFEWPASDSPASGWSGPWLVRPLLVFRRADTERICRNWPLPVWRDASNDDRRFSRNRVRGEILPVLETLHPGADLRISAQAERLAEEIDQEEEVLTLAVAQLRVSGPSGTAAGPDALDRRALHRLSAPNRRRLLQHWLRSRLGRPLAAESLESLLSRLSAGRGPGRADLPAGWKLGWDRTTLILTSPADPP